MTLAAHRTSVWLSHPPMHTDAEPPKRPRARRRSTFGNMRPSTSSSAFDVIGEGDLQARFSTRRPHTHRPKPDDFESHSWSMSKRASFIDFGEDSHREFLDNGFLGSFKKSLHRKSSAPLLSGSSFVTSDTMPSMAPSTPTKSSKTLSGIKWPSPKRSHKEKGSSLRQSLYLPTRSSRKSLGGTKTPVPVPVPVLPQRRCSQGETETFEAIDGTEARYEPLSLVRKGCSRFHKYPPSEAPYMQCYNRSNLQK